MKRLFRVVNDELRALHGRFDDSTDMFSIVCECDEASCTEPIEISQDEYARMRSDPNRFAIKPGHE